MPEIQPIPAVTFDFAGGNDITDRIAPPYDVLDETSKAALLNRNPHNIVAVDLPHLPPKTVGPDATYVEAGQRYQQWLNEGVLKRSDKPAIYVYQQTYTVGEQTFKRRGLITNIPVQPFGKGANGKGGVHPHEQTFSSAKEDRLKLMRATQAQLSPIFGLYSDPEEAVNPLLAGIVESGPATFLGKTADGVLHEVWQIDDADQIAKFQSVLGDKDVFIADGHHRYTTALNHKNELEAAGKDPGKAASCLFVLVSMQDPGMIVLPTHRVLGNMPNFDMDKFKQAAQGKLNLEPFPGKDLAALEAALATHKGPHAIGLYDPAGGDNPLWIATTLDSDPLKATHPDQSEAWRQLDVAIVQQVIVEAICEPTFCGEGESVTWKFPHDLEQVKEVADSDGYQLAVIVQATPLDSVRQVSEAGELMPQKSTFFYPKLATGLVVNPLD